MNEAIEKKSSRQSMGITAIVAVLTLLLLLITFSFTDKKEIPAPIEIAMNFGNTDQGSGPEEPMPSESSSSAASSAQQSTSSPSAQSPIKEAVTQDVSEPRTTASNPKSSTSESKTTTPSESQKPKGDTKGKNALNDILGGKGNKPSRGQGDGTSSGNVGDPKGNSDTGNGVENWLTRIPANQKHRCDASGDLKMKVTVRANGSVKSVTPSRMYDDCLVKRAKELIFQYVTARRGADGRVGYYTVQLK